MNYDDNACHLFARFGAGAQQIDLRITRVAPGDNFDLVLAGQPLMNMSPHGNVTIAFPPTKPISTKHKALFGTAGEKKLPMAHLKGIRFDGAEFRADTPMPPVSPALEKEINSIVFAVGRKNIELETGSMGQPMASMRACLTDLVRHWGYDPEVQSKLLRRPAPLSSPGTWLSSNDYPKDSLRQSGLVRFRLDISETGQVTSCVILQRTNPDSFADLTCKLIIRRGKFAPALDAEGKPVKAYFASGVTLMASAY